MSLIDFLSGEIILEDSRHCYFIAFLNGARVYAKMKLLKKNIALLINQVCSQICVSLNWNIQVEGSTDVDERCLCNDLYILNELLSY